MLRTRKQAADHVDTRSPHPSKRRRVEGGVSRVGTQLKDAKQPFATSARKSDLVVEQTRKNHQEEARIGKDASGRARGRAGKRTVPVTRTVKHTPQLEENPRRSSSKEREPSASKHDDTTVSTIPRRGRSRHTNPDVVDIGTSRPKAEVIIKPLTAKMKAKYAKVELQPSTEPGGEEGVVKRKRGRPANVKVGEDDAGTRKVGRLPKKRDVVDSKDAPRRRGRPSRTLRTSSSRHVDEDVEDELVAGNNDAEDDIAVVTPIMPRRCGRPPKKRVTGSEGTSAPEVGPRKSRRQKVTGDQEDEVVAGEVKRKTPRRRNKGIGEDELAADVEYNIETIPTPRRGSTSTLQPDAEAASDEDAQRSKHPRRTVVRTRTMESMPNDLVSLSPPAQSGFSSSIDVEIRGNEGDSDGTSRGSSPNDDEHQNTNKLTSARILVTKPILSPPSAAKTNNPDSWDTTRLLTDRRSLLLDMNIHSLFTQEVWNQLPASARQECLELLPDIDKVYPEDAEEQTESSGAELRSDFLQYNSFLTEAIDDFTACLSSGAYAPSFLRSALVTNAACADGLYDSWKDSQSESYWGQKQRLDNPALAGDAKGVKLGDVVRGSNGVVGDVWVYDRIFTSKKGEMRIGGKRKTMDTMRVRKEVTLTAIDPLTYALTFSAPEGQEVYPSADTTMVMIPDVLTPNMLEHRVLDIHGKLERKERPNGNAWKCFRVRRNEHDLGTLFEIRQRWYGSTLVDR
ncbi:hypothetical protein SAICODRAFT_179422 [Saitoella complicata NRRL Y-17804]|uniref:uncharacterized protein n=1 Tax=Saitoella complicata (strain BCRC 22490 / CBS 7301 / JCM 7358 / NBRC 10748 / NRRL Y-17804) TaxID=698492 RepID=UPI000866D499|nr:uncharacterized protein SAICODRAFT_179422 [Saitoella complicata NRRL Y-17804]ODQ50200.1 hypothetical protein SAICODRAFT_179422 [Saitoella complicata NRRL Y-17804]